MAKNSEPEPVKRVESESESGEEDEEEDDASSEEVGSSDSDSESQRPTAPSTKEPSAILARKKPQLHSQSSKPTQSSSSEEEDESDSESDPDLPDPNVKPLVSKPMDDPPKATTSLGSKKSRSNPGATGPASPLRSTGSKRPAEEKEVKETKRSKTKPETVNSEKKASVSNDDSKKQLFQRLWSEDDEIVVLKGMLDYWAEKNSDPVADLNAFHDFIKKNLHVDATRAQLQDKIRRLKKKYVNKGREKKGKEKMFSKAHEQRAYELSKKIWGNNDGYDNGGEKEFSSPKANGSAVRKAPINKAKGESGDLKEQKNLEVKKGDKDMAMVKSERLDNGNVGERVLMNGMESFEEEKAVDLEREWRKLRVKQAELHLKKLDLMCLQMKVALDVFRASDH